MSYYRMDNAIMEALGFVGKGGEVIPLLPADKLVYVYMRQKIELYVGKLDNTFHTSQSVMAKDCGMSLSTFQRSLKKFRDSGVVHSRVEKIGSGKWSNTVYTRVSPLSLVYEVQAKKKGKNQIKDSPPFSDDSYEPF